MRIFDPADAFRKPTPVQTPSISYPISNFQGLIQIEQQYQQRAELYAIPRLGTKHHIYTNARLVEESSVSPSGGGLVSFNRTFLILPNQPFEEPVTISYTFPGHKQHRTWVREYVKDEVTGYRTKVQYRLQDNVETRQPLTKTIIGKKVTEWIDLTSAQFGEPSTQIDLSSIITHNGEYYKAVRINTTTGSVSIIINGVLTELEQGSYAALKAPPNGINFNKVNIEQAFQVTHNPLVFSGQGGQQLYNSGGRVSQQPTDYTDNASSNPSTTGYLQMVESGFELQTETTQLEQYRGTIYTKTRTLVKAQ